MKYTTKQIVLSAMLAAILLCGKFVLNFIPNVEVVTLIVIVSAFVLPPRVVLTAVLVFCTGVGVVYGFGSWLIAYYIYWPMMAAVAIPLKAIKSTGVRNIAAVTIAVVLTVFFGVLTSLIDAIFYSNGLSFFTAFGLIYLGGISFYITQILSSVIGVGLLFTPLSLALKRATGSKRAVSSLS